MNRHLSSSHGARLLSTTEVAAADPLTDHYAPARLEKLTHGEGAPNKLKKNPFLKVLTLTYLLSGIWSVWRICREKRIDILHVHWPFPHGLMALLPAWLARVKILSSCHGAEIALAARNRWSTALLASCLRRSNAVTANSRPDSEKSPRKMRKLYLWDRNAGEYSSFREKPGNWFY